MDLFDGYIPKNPRELFEQWQGCTKCSFREGQGEDIKPVFGRGSRHPIIAVIGHHPASEEHRTGKPHQGPAGQASRELFERAGISKSDIFWSNILMCCPDRWIIGHVQNCSSRLRAEFNILKPKLCVVMGGRAARAMGLKDSMKDIHGRVFHYLETIPVIPIPHPGILIRDDVSVSAKEIAAEQLREDLAFIKSQYDLLKEQA